MNIFLLSFRNIVYRPLNSALTLVLLTMGVGLIALLIQVNGQIQEQMKNNIRGIDMVVGAKGSPLQLILSAVYHIDSPTGNIPLNEARKLEKNFLIKGAIPLSYGDNYNNYRIVGTEYSYPELYEAALAQGELWQKSFEVSLGATVAAEQDLKIGDTFIGSHGLTQGGEGHDHQTYKVVGIFEPTNSVMDQLILTSTKSVWDVHRHEEGHHEHEHSNKSKEVEQVEEDREITAVLIKFRSPAAIVQLPRIINESTNMQAAVPSFELSRLFGLMGFGLESLKAIALIIILVSGLSVFISLYNALSERKYELALMRTYGASRWQLLWLVLQEGLILSISGFVLGMLFSRAGLWLISRAAATNYHYKFDGLTWSSEELLLLVASTLIGLIASLLPAIQTFRINISKTLANV